MRLQAILHGQAIRLLSVTGPEGGGVYGGKLARACEERYGFLEVPRSLADFDLENGVTFRHGTYGGMLIDRLQVYSNGVLAEARLNTDICDGFLDDVVGWFSAEAGVIFDEKAQSERAYVSSLEFTSEMQMDSLFRPLDSILAEVNAIIAKYANRPVSFEFHAFQFRQSIAQSSVFRIEKSPKLSESGPLFFATSPCRTSDLLELLERVESTLLSL